MIRNYNIAPNAQIDMSKIVGGGAGPMTGEVFWVCKEGIAARDWLVSRIEASKLFTTIAEASAACTAERGDVVYVAPGHTETVIAASQVNLAKANVSVIGLGRGTDMPLLDYTVAAGEMTITAANVTVKNIRFHSNVTDVLKAIDVEATGTDFLLEDCVFDVETTTTDEFAVCVNIVAGAHRTRVKNCYMDMGLQAGAAAGVLLDGASSNVQILGNQILGDYSTGCIAGGTAPALVLSIGNNILSNGVGTNIGAVATIALNGASTGIIFNNYCACNLATKAASIVAASCFLFENYYNEDVSGAATGGLIGAASADD